MVANLSVLTAGRGLKTLVVDADLGLAGIHVLFGLTPSLHIGDVLDGAPVDEALLSTREGVTILPAATGDTSLTHLAMTHRLLVRQLWDDLAERFDVIFLDCPPGLHRDGVWFAAAAQRVVLVATAEPTSVVDAAAVACTLKAQTAVRSADVIVNCVRSERQAQLAFGRLQNLCDASDSIRLNFAGSVPDDHNMRRAGGLSRPLVSLAPRSPAARALASLELNLLGPGFPSHENVGGDVVGFGRRLREGQTKPLEGPLSLA